MGTSAIIAWAKAGAALGLATSLLACDRLVAPPVEPQNQAQPIVPRADLFGDATRERGQLSPSGDRVAFLAQRDGVANLWVLGVGAADDARPLSDERDLGVSGFVWAQDGATLIYGVEDDAGATRLFAVAADGGSPPRALTPATYDARILGVTPRDPNVAVIALRAPGAVFADVVRLSLADGERTTVYRNTGGYSDFLVDRDNRLRLAVKRLEDGGQEIAARNDDGSWRALFPIAFPDAMSSRLIAFESGGTSFLMLDSTDRDRTALVRVDAETGVKTVVGESARADVVDLWLDPATNAPEAFATDYLRREWRALNHDAQADLDFLDQQLTGEFAVVSRSNDDSRWIVTEEGPVTPARSHLYDRASRRLSLLFRHRPGLDGAPLQSMTPVEIEARDGLTLVTYLTLPVGSDLDGDARPDQPVPLVLTPHDGLGGRDSYGFNALHQWLANRGYAVMSVNFRGSIGFNKAFVNAGNLEWGARVQDDLMDAVQWAVSNGVARQDRIAILGSGFGGFAALQGLALASGEFRCGASLGGVANLSAFIDTAPADLRADLYQRIGDPRTAPGRERLRAQSPISRVNRIESPLLLAFGARDSRVTRTDLDQIAQSLAARRVGVTYFNFPQEGSVLRRARNRLAYFTVLEHFLGDCLGGRVEPVGASFEGAAMEVYQGAVNVPGLSAFTRRAARRPAGAAPAAAPVEPAPQHEEAAGVPTEVRAAPAPLLPVAEQP